jgi:hypothetical protein
VCCTNYDILIFYSLSTEAAKVCFNYLHTLCRTPSAYGEAEFGLALS